MEKKNDISQMEKWRKKKKKNKQNLPKTEIESRKI